MKRPEINTTRYIENKAFNVLESLYDCNLTPESILCVISVSSAIQCAFMKSALNIDDDIINICKNVHVDTIEVMS